MIEKRTIYVKPNTYGLDVAVQWRSDEPDVLTMSVLNNRSEGADPQAELSGEAINELVSALNTLNDLRVTE